MKGSLGKSARQASRSRRASSKLTVAVFQILGTALEASASPIVDATCYWDSARPGLWKPGLAWPGGTSWPDLLRFVASALAWLGPEMRRVQAIRRRAPSSAASRSTRSRLRSAHRPEARSLRRLCTALRSASGPTVAQTDMPRRTFSSRYASGRPVADVAAQDGCLSQDAWQVVTRWFAESEEGLGDRSRRAFIGSWAAREWRARDEAARGRRCPQPRRAGCAFEGPGSFSRTRNSTRAVLPSPVSAASRLRAPTASAPRPPCFTPYAPPTQGVPKRASQ